MKRKIHTSFASVTIYGKTLRYVVWIERPFITIILTMITTFINHPLKRQLPVYSSWVYKPLSQWVCL